MHKLCSVIKEINDQRKGQTQTNRTHQAEERGGDWQLLRDWNTAANLSLISELFAWECTPTFLRLCSHFLCFTTFIRNIENHLFNRRWDWWERKASWSCSIWQTRPFCAQNSTTAKADRLLHLQTWSWGLWRVTWVNSSPSCSFTPPHLPAHPKAGWEKRTGEAKVKKPHGLRRKEFNNYKKTTPKQQQQN